MESWTHNSIKSHGDKPWLVGKYDDRKVGGCIILGGSKAVWEDYHEARVLFENQKDYDIIAINDIAALFKAENIEHICSVHQQILQPLRALRMIRITNHPYTHAQKAHEGVDFAWGNLLPNGGTSALFAVKIAMAMGYKKIILAGCGLDKTGHFYDPDIPEDNNNGWFDEACRMPWKDFHKENKEAERRVRFMSGELAKVFGTPTHEWVYNLVGV